MSKITSLRISSRLRTVQGFALWAAFGGLAACGTSDTNEGAVGRRASEVSTDTAITPVSGQSGTEYEGGGGDRPACPCGTLHNPLRGTIVEIVRHIEGADFRPVRLGNVRLRVEELLGDTTGLELGSEISGTWFGDLPCFSGCASVEVGDEVLAFYRPAQPCVDTSGDDCPFSDTIAASIALTPWSDTVVLAEFARGDLTLAIDDIPWLESPECREHLGNTSELIGPNDSGEACYEFAP